MTLCDVVTYPLRVGATALLDALFGVEEDLDYNPDFLRTPPPPAQVDLEQAA